MIRISKSVKLKQEDVYSEVLVTGIDVKCNFTSKTNENLRKMLNIATKLLEGGLETRHFKDFFLKTKPYDQGQNYGY